MKEEFWWAQAKQGSVWNGPDVYHMRYEVWTREGDRGSVTLEPTKINVECCVQKPFSEALHQGWKLKLPLYVKVTWVLQARVGCFILTDKISNSKNSDNLILGNKVSWQVRNSSCSKWGLLWHVTAAVCPRDTWCFLLTLQLDLSIFPAWCGMLWNVAGQILIFSVWANSFLFCY